MNPRARSHPTVCIVTSHGRQSLSGESNERVIDLLKRHSVPWSAVSIYAIPKSGGEPIIYPCLDLTLDQCDDVSEILLYFNRNVNPFIFGLDQFKTVGPEGLEQATEYFYQRLDNARSSSEVFLKKLSPDECRSIIADRVAETIRTVIPTGEQLVIGVSGGGDSNALLYGLSQVRDHLTLHPIIIKGIPDWDLGVPRAQELCDSYGIDLKIVEEQEVKDLLGIPRNSPALIDRFEREFKGDDFEFLGTLLIRLALSKYARDIGTTLICTGLNLEDVLCENMFRISTGLKPASFPTRTIGETILVLPLWLCPKRIIDGCFPKYSLENYDARYPCFSLGRNLYYSVVYTMQSQFPGFLEQMARGLSDLSLKDPVTYSFDEQLGFHIERFVPFGLRRKFLRMLGGSTPSP
jgi:tRNA(Ile)-lysidine synthase TilS/MesJ